LAHAYRIFSSFLFFFAGQQSKPKEKLKNEALNMFLVVNEPEEHEFSLKKSFETSEVPNDYKVSVEREPETFSKFQAKNTEYTEYT
jgi:hypothetical protein